ncbi:MAG TPA: phosphatase PAP2 family protein [Verrucomicrobiae bacterium]|nr:phosphatase PAP2 family protein [Verrucomicrobiae bacterium]
MFRQTISRFDHRITDSIKGDSRLFELIYGWITLLGHPMTVVFIAALGVITGLGLQKIVVSYAFIAALAALVGSTILKGIMRRPRPDTLYANAMWRKTFSFPSGHSFGSLVVYGLLAYFAYAYFIAPWNIVGPLGIGLVIFLVGISRIYLGAHYFLDVIGGWLLSLPVLLWIITGIIN